MRRGNPCQNPTPERRGLKMADPKVLREIRYHATETTEMCWSAGFSSTDAAARWAAQHSCQSPELDPWEPIETAPKDGTEVDLWLVPHSGRGRRIIGAWWVSSGWRTGDGMLDSTLRLSHWMRAPQSPRGEG